MTSNPHYPTGRASAPTADVGIVTQDGHIPRPDYDLIERLRAVRANGDEAMQAAEQYDPNFSLKLSACEAPGDAEALLDAWLDHRVAALRRTQSELRRVWQEGRDRQAAAG